jgi:chromosome segregation ATPase
MSRETLKVLEARLQTFLARHEQVTGEREALVARLTTMERAYEELLERLRSYERERAEIRRRLGRLLSRLGVSAPPEADRTP